MVLLATMVTARHELLEVCRAYADIMTLYPTQRNAGPQLGTQEESCSEMRNLAW